MTEQTVRVSSGLESRAVEVAGLPPVLVVAGPTGAGKSDAALVLAAALNGVIINADSRQVYRDFPLITARPSPAEEARCPHELYGFLETPDKLSAGRWAEQARERVEAAHAAGRLPILTGGTGLYLRALLDGMADIPPVPHEIAFRWIARWLRERSAAVYAELTRVDPEYAARVHPHDRQRVLRALEVWEATGRTFTWWHSQTPAPPPWHVRWYGMGLSRAELTGRLVGRIERMLEAGAVEEARAAMERCDDPDAPGWSGIGCAELLAYLTGSMTFDEAKTTWISKTRAYAKRQSTWFRAEPRLVWFRPGEEAKLLEAAKAELGLR